MLRIALILALGAAALLGAACGAGDDDAAPPTEQPAAAPGQTFVVLNQPQPVQAPNGPPRQPEEGVYEIIAENAAFQGNDVSIALGSTAVIRVVNRDELTHNLRLAGLDGQFDTEDDAVTEPAAVQAGGSGEFTFAPAVAGAYTFRCDYHPGTMGGRITVE